MQDNLTLVFIWFNFDRRYKCFGSMPAKENQRTIPGISRNRRSRETFKSNEFTIFFCINRTKSNYWQRIVGSIDLYAV